MNADPIDQYETHGLGAVVRDRYPADPDSNNILVVMKHNEERANQLTLDNGKTIAELNAANPTEENEPLVSAAYPHELDHQINAWRTMHEKLSGPGFVDFVKSFEKEWNVQVTVYAFPASRLTAAENGLADEDDR